MMKNLAFLLIPLTFGSCFLNKERRQWNSKKYTDNHFYSVLAIPKIPDTTALKLNRMYVYQKDSIQYNHILFSKDQKVYSSQLTQGPIDEAKMKNTQIHSGYFTTKNDTIIIEEIRVINYFTGNGRDGLPLVYRHFKTIALVRNDSLFVSEAPIIVKKSDWDKTPGHLYKPIVHKLY